MSITHSIRGFLVTFAIVAGFVLIPAANSDAAANRTSAKVTICHRTHATTNPYRQITVSVNSVIKNNGHDDSTHNKDGDANFPKYVDETPVYVFDPEYDYTPNAKMWGDIIPAFTYTTTEGGEPQFFEGRNWTAAGKAIYYGLGEMAGLCSDTGAKEFALSEYDEWLKDFPGQNSGNQPNNGDITSKKREIINDLKGQENIKDGDLKDFDTDFDALPAEPKKPKGPKRPKEFSDLINNVDDYNANSRPGGAPINQALAGVVWKDMNNDGVQDADEEIFDNLGIQIIDPDTGLPLTPEQLAQLSLLSESDPQPAQAPFITSRLLVNTLVLPAAATTITLYTDENGYFEVPSLPEGDWEVNVITPDGWQYTYDSTGSSDGEMPGTYVPAGGAGFAWAGLVFVGDDSGDGSGGDDSGDGSGGEGSGNDGDDSSNGALPDTGANEFLKYGLMVAIAFILLGSSLIVRRSHQ